MYELNLHLACLLFEGNNNFQHLPTGTFHLLYNYVMTKYDLHHTYLSIPIDTTRGRDKNGTTVLKPGTLAVAYQI